ncbi:helix-turn-helix transcriptional regulator [Thalassotalea sp. 1_MG-2023]|uniref:helix-turn-helix domain-containing protein n=1 Tax=Thalassotalea sp. 1_MG-2023 TaxID=3062680 RepID=UPI0026E12EFE|nr:helix-turn-helix transcriptional regulator [Thalassotalea sp. 1_MG-2023]MDO6427163.1 helix-turn-helix transcriptional regulator [Thalassotalea sp. 1_MG-2023]
MDINAKKIKQLRTDRAWTQQHLADACGVSLRTIQRAERYGNSSKETLMALAAVFEQEQATLLDQVNQVEVVERFVEITPQLKRRTLLLAGIVGLVLGVFITIIVQSLM